MAMMLTYIAVGLIGSSRALPQILGVEPAIALSGLSSPVSAESLPSTPIVAIPSVGPMRLSSLSASIPSLTPEALSVSTPSLVVPSWSILVTVPLTGLVTVVSTPGLTSLPTLPVPPSTGLPSILTPTPQPIPPPIGNPSASFPLPTGLPTSSLPTLGGSLPLIPTPPPIVAVFQSIGNELLGSLISVVVAGSVTPIPTGLAPSLPNLDFPRITATPIPAKREAVPEPQLLGGILTKVFPKASVPPVPLPSPLSVVFPSHLLPSTGIPTGLAVPSISAPSVGLPSLLTDAATDLPFLPSLPSSPLLPATAVPNTAIPTTLPFPPASLTLPIPAISTGLPPTPPLPSPVAPGLQFTLALLSLLSFLDPTAFASLSQLTDLVAVQAVAGQLSEADLWIVVGAISKTASVDGRLSHPVDFVTSIGDLVGRVEDFPAAVGVLVLQQMGIVNVVGGSRGDIITAIKTRHDTEYRR